MKTKIILFASLIFFNVTHGQNNVNENIVQYTNMWAVQLSVNKVGVLEKLKKIEGFETIEQILWAEQVSRKKVELRFYRCPGRSIFGTSNYKHIMNDKYFSHQWYLQDCRTSNYETKFDLNVLPVWHKYKIFGRGIKVIVFDDGVQTDHLDLKDNYDPEYGYDFEEKDIPPTSKFCKSNILKKESHGTKCAGIIGMQANNKVCGVGIAPLVTLGALRIIGLHKKLTQLDIAQAFLFKAKDVDISNNSWGYAKKGKLLTPISAIVMNALKKAITQGRRSKGIIFTFAGGNEKIYGDTCAHDSFANLIYTITVAGVKHNGDSVYYSEKCSNILVTAFSGDGNSGPWSNIVTTTNHSCTRMFNGTSASAPMVSGIVALILEANSNLSWREVQHILAWTSQIAPLAHNKTWSRNQAGFYFSLDFGFGLVDAFQAVSFAMTIAPISPMNCCVLSIKIEEKLVFKRKFDLRIQIPTSGCKHLPSEVNYIEHVQLMVSVEHPRRGAIQIMLVSPAGTRSLLMDSRWSDKSKHGFHQWVLDTVHFWGEAPEGVWSIFFFDSISDSRYEGIVTQVVLMIYGTKYKPSHYDTSRIYYKFVAQ